MQMKRRVRKKKIRRSEKRIYRNLEKYLAEERILNEHEEYKQLLPLKKSLDALRSWYLYLEDRRIYKKRFVDSSDYISVEERDGIIIVSGEFSWWVNHAKESWWPDDRTPQVTKYGSEYMTEPFNLKIKFLNKSRQLIAYEFHLGMGSTRRAFRYRWR